MPTLTYDPLALMRSILVRKSEDAIEAEIVEYDTKRAASLANAAKAHADGDPGWAAEMLANADRGLTSGLLARQVLAERRRRPILAIAPHHMQELVAVDWPGGHGYIGPDGLRPIQPVLDWLNGQHALLAYEQGTTTTPAGVEVLEHRVTFDAGRVRNTDVHGLAYQRGFVAHIA